MGQLNENEEEDERKFAIGGSVGCLVAIVIGFSLLVAFIIFIFVYSIGNGVPADGSTPPR